MDFRSLSLKRPSIYWLAASRCGCREKHALKPSMNTPSRCSNARAEAGVTLATVRRFAASVQARALRDVAAQSEWRCQSSVKAALKRRDRLRAAARNDVCEPRSSHHGLRRQGEAKMSAFDLRAALRFQLAGVLCLSLVVGGCSGPAPEPRTVRVGAVLPLTGAYAFFGVSIRDALLMAQRSLGEHRRFRVQLIFEDGQLDPSASLKATLKLLDVDKVDAIFSFNSGIGNLISPLADKRRIVHIAIASDPKVAQGAFNFIHWTPAVAEVRLLVDELANRGIHRIAVIGVAGGGGQIILDAIKQLAPTRGIELVAEELFATSEVDFRTILLKTVRQKAEIVVVLVSTEKLDLIARQRNEMGITIPLTSVENFEFTDHPELFEGSWYINTAEGSDEFREHYRSLYGSSPNAGAANAYDALRYYGCDRIRRTGTGRKAASRESSRALAVRQGARRNTRSGCDFEQGVCDGSECQGNPGRSACLPAAVDRPAIMLLEAVKLVAGYGRIDVLCGVDIAIQPQEFVALVGPNGAGKSTVLRSVFGLASIRSGSLQFLGQDILSLPPRHLVDRGMCYVPQGGQVFPSLTVRQNLDLGWLDSIQTHVADQRTGASLQRFPGLRAKCDGKAANLSGGERQLVGIVRALALRPKLLLLDEPFAGLSSDVARSVAAALASLNAEGSTILMVEQNLEFVQRLASRLCHLVNGRVVTGS